MKTIANMLYSYILPALLTALAVMVLALIYKGAPYL